MYFALHKDNLFNNKSIVKGNKVDAPISKVWNIRYRKVSGINALGNILTRFPKNAMIVDSTPKDKTKKQLQLLGSHWLNESDWLIIDAEYSDTLPPEYKKTYSADEYVALIRKKLNYHGQLLISSSSRWELKGEQGWHIYIPLDGVADRTELKRFLLGKLKGHLFYGTSSKADAVRPTLYKRCDLLDTEIYTVARKIYEATQLSGTRKKIIIKDAGDGSKLKVETIHRANSHAKAPEFVLRPETEKKLAEIKANGVKRYGTEKYDRLLALNERGLLAPDMQLKTKAGLKTVKEIVDAKHRVQFMSELDTDRYAGEYYPNNEIFVDNHAGLKWRMDLFSVVEKAEFVGTDFYDGEVGARGATTGMGKTTAFEAKVKKENKAGIIALPSRNQAKKAAFDKGFIYLEAESTGGLRFDIETLEAGKVYVMTYAKVYAHLTTIADSEVLVLIDEAHNLLTTNFGSDKPLIAFLEQINLGRFYSASGTQLKQFTDIKKQVYRDDAEIEIKIVRNCHWREFYTWHDKWLVYRGGQYSKSGITIDAQYLREVCGETVVITADEDVESIELTDVNVIANRSGLEALDVNYSDDVDFAIAIYDPDPIELVQFIGRYRGKKTPTVYVITTDTKLKDKLVRSVASELSKSDDELLKFYLENILEMNMYKQLQEDLPKIVQGIESREYTESEKKYVAIRKLAQQLMSKSKYSRGYFLNIINDWGKYKFTEFHSWKKVQTLGKESKVMEESWKDLKYELSCFGEMDETSGVLTARKKVAEIDKLADIHNANEEIEFGDDVITDDEKYDLYNTPKQFRLFKKHCLNIKTGAYDELFVLTAKAGLIIGKGSSITNKAKRAKLAKILRGKYPKLKKDLTIMQVIKKFYQVSYDETKIVALYVYPISPDVVFAPDNV